MLLWLSLIRRGEGRGGAVTKKTGRYCHTSYIGMCRCEGYGFKQFSLSLLWVEGGAMDPGKAKGIILQKTEQLLKSRI